MSNCSLLVLALCFACIIRLHAQEAPVPSSNGNGGIDKSLQTELLAILEDDQKGRSKIDTVAKAHGHNSPEIQALWRSINEQDAINVAKIKVVLNTRGWVGPDVVGPEANSTLFLVIQHADTVTQQKYLPLMRVAVREKKAFPRQLALLEDRIALAEGRRQTYGSQLMSDKVGRYYVRPLEDPDHVDERRHAMGLGTMAEYLKHWNLVWDVEAYKKQLPSLEARESTVKR